MRKFLDDNFLLETKSAQELYHAFAKDLPIIDYHCHLPPKDILNNRVFNSITEAWLEGDHYKWRAMRTNGVDERYCTGDASDQEKFMKWAETVPYTMRNPLYHWTHLELQRYFGIEDILGPDTAEDIYIETNRQLANMSTNAIFEKMKVEVVCTTDDPIDSLEYHQTWTEEGHDLILAPTFRADKVLFTADLKVWNTYIDQLARAAGVEINTYHQLLEALSNRHDFFHSLGCRLSDNGLETLSVEDYTGSEITGIFTKLRGGAVVPEVEAEKYRSAILVELAHMNHAKGWTQQYHLGALRNNNTRMMNKLGLDTGFDSIGDFPLAQQMSKFFDRLDSTDQLAKTIIYNLNPADNALFATMIGNFNDGSTAGKMQFGSGWWFLDQKDGIEQQINALSNMGLLSRFVGMLTDSRSFLSFPRHEYFRRVLCNIFGNDIEKGELPNDLNWIGQIVQQISYYNAKEYFQFHSINTKTTVS
ncbi:MAG: glucuronate isomerase [Cyclobacteriaceae bacterium]|nr:glucuronate isomerase [Cyclobacteriaceae bacterium HetDA_MAG_MS6]